MSKYKNGYFYTRFVRVDTIESKIGKMKAKLLEGEKHIKRARRSTIDLNMPPDSQFGMNADCMTFSQE